MADETKPTVTELEVQTRSKLAYILCIGGLLMMAYILYMWGSQKEILTLIIGLLGGTVIGQPIAVYFGGSAQTKKPDPITPTTVLQTGDQPTTQVTPPTETK